MRFRRHYSRNFWFFQILLDLWEEWNEKRLRKRLDREIEQRKEQEETQ